GLRIASTVSPYIVLGDSRDRYCDARISVSSLLVGTNAATIAGARAGQIRLRNSQSPSVTSAAVAADRNRIENSIASANQTPAYAIVTSRKISARAISSPLGGTPRRNSPSPITSSQSAIRLIDSVNSPAMNLPNS